MSEQELVFLKLGGSLLTDKTRPKALRVDELHRLAAEIADALGERPELRLLIGHGSGSFGHVVADRYGTHRGARSPEGWRGFAATARVAAELNRLVVDALAEAGAAVLPIQPSASALCADGELQELAERPIRAALENGLVPVVHGDVALDLVRGATIVSTEVLFRWLALRLHPQRVILAGEVPGVMTADPASGVRGEIISEVSQATYGEIAPLLGASRGIDVTGGMMAKVEQMLALVAAVPGLAEVRIISGLAPGTLQRVLLTGAAPGGTRIRA